MGSTEVRADRGRVRRLVMAAAFLAGLGVAAGVTAFATYITRYSTFDALQGEIDAGLYRSITTVAPAERVAVALGVGLILLAVVLLMTASFLVRRRCAAPSNEDRRA